MIRIRLVVPALLVLSALTGCGSGDGNVRSEGSSTGNTSPGTAAPTTSVYADEAALEAALLAWVPAAAATYGPFSPPIYGAADAKVLAFLPVGADAVVFCDDVVSVGADAGLDPVDVVVIANLDDVTPLAHSTAGSACTAG